MKDSYALPAFFATSSEIPLLSNLSTAPMLTAKVVVVKSDRQNGAHFGLGFPGNLPIEAAIFSSPTIRNCVAAALINSWITSPGEL